MKPIDVLNKMIEDQRVKSVKRLTTCEAICLIRDEDYPIEHLNIHPEVSRLKTSMMKECERLGSWNASVKKYNCPVI